MFPLIIVGFAMITLGAALLLLGEVPFLGGKRIAARRSRLIGVVLISFLPLAYGVHQLMSWYFREEYDVDGPTVAWAVLGLCLLVVGIILFRVVVPKGQAPKKSSKRSTVSKPAEAIQFVELVPIDDPYALDNQPPAPKGKKPPAKKSSQPPTEEENPFNFG
jgi:hypothetical protein